MPFLEKHKTPNLDVAPCSYIVQYSTVQYSTVQYCGPDEVSCFRGLFRTCKFLSLKGPYCDQLRVMLVQIQRIEDGDNPETTQGLR